MIQDKSLLGTISGILANIIMDIPQYPLWKLKIIRHPLSHYAGSLFVDLYTLHHTWYGSVASFLADYTYSALLGIIFVYWLSVSPQKKSQQDKSQRRHFLLKGLLYGAFLWFGSFGVLRSLHVVKLREVVPSDALLFFFLHLLFGLVLGWMAQKYLDSTGVLCRSQRNSGD